MVRRIAYPSGLAAALESVHLAADGVELGRGEHEQPFDQRQQRVRLWMTA